MLLEKMAWICPGWKLECKWQRGGRSREVLSAVQQAMSRNLRKRGKTEGEEEGRKEGRMEWIKERERERESKHGQEVALQC